MKLLLIFHPSGMEMSPPTRGRGLKRERGHGAYSCDVAPHAGAWIETETKEVEDKRYFVAPHAGAWIETAKN